MKVDNKNVFALMLIESCFVDAINEVQEKRYFILNLEQTQRY